jgi:signal transduction histidine kinase/DNA-binding NarL/FixJ family response regulator
MTSSSANHTPAITVLLVEDEALIAEEIRHSLERAGLIVSGTPSSAKEAIESCIKCRPDIAIVDIRLKGNIDGIDTASTLRTQFNIPIIFLTAHANESDLERAKKVEPVGFVMKPVVIPELVAGLKLGLVKHEAERKLRASEQRLATTLRCFSDAVIVVDRDSKVTFLNESSFRLLQISRENGIGCPLSSILALIHPHERHSLLPDILATSHLIESKNQGTQLPQKGILLRGKDEVPLEIQSVPLEDGSGTTIGSILVMRDISEQLRVDAIRLQLEDRLFQVQKMESLGQLAGGIAHDFNNLLTAIMGNISLLQQIGLPNQQKLLTATEQACFRAAELVRQLLSFGRDEPESKKPIHLAPILTEVIEVLRAASAQHIVIDLQISSNLPAVLGNSSKLYQLIMNLCMNARDAVLEKRLQSPANNQDPVRPELIISLSRRTTPHHLRATLGEEANDVVELCVKDSGIGMTEETKRRIFEPFFTTKAVGKGTGLGLATVYGVVRNLGGAIEVETELHCGTTFRVLLPAHYTESSRSFPVSPISDTFRGSGTIIIADEDPLVRDIIGAMFDELGYSPIGATSESELLSLLSKSDTAVRAILCNSDIGPFGSADLITSIHQHSPITPILLITSHGTTSSDLPKAARVSILQKPYKLHDLAREVATIVAEKN